MPDTCQVFETGSLELHSALLLQDKLARETAKGVRPGCLILCEQPLTYVSSSEISESKAAEFHRQYNGQRFRVEIMENFHGSHVFGPGQLRGVLLIKAGEKNTAELSRKLEEMLILLLSKLGLAAGQIRGKPGVWLHANVASRCPRCRPEDRKKPAKIADVDIIIGADGITRQGFTLNINPDMEMIETLGSRDPSEGPFVSLEEIFPDPPAIDLVKQSALNAFSECFNMKMIRQKFDFLD